MQPKQGQCLSSSSASSNMFPMRCRQFLAGPMTHCMLGFEVQGGWRDVNASVTMTVLQYLMGGGGSFSAGGPGEHHLQTLLPKYCLHTAYWKSSPCVAMTTSGHGLEYRPRLHFTSCAPATMPVHGKLTVKRVVMTSRTVRCVGLPTYLHHCVFSETFWKQPLSVQNAPTLLVLVSTNHEGTAPSS